jgi:hypothetical protein
MFNKKRQCCCNTPVTGPTFFECFSKIPIASGELSQSGTYSFWVKKDIALTDLTDSFAFFPQSSSVSPGNTNNTSGTLTWGDFKTAGNNSVFVPFGFPTMTESGTTNAGFLSDSLFDQPYGLNRRGWHFTSSSRTLTQAQWDALSEHRTLFEFPFFAQNFGNSQMFEFTRFGFLFVSDLFNSSPALSETRGALTWELNPGLVANIPDIYGFPSSGKKFFDFTHNFPSSITITISGTAPFAYGDGTHTTGVPGANAPKTADINLSGNIVADKTTAFGFGTIPLQYTVNASTSTAVLGSADVEVDDGAGNITTKTVEILNQTSGSFIIKTQGISSPPIRCRTDIGFGANLNRFVCDACDPNSGTYSYGDCSPKNYDGDLGEKNVCAIVDREIDFSDNTLGLNIPGPFIPPDLPIGYAWEFQFQVQDLIEGLDIAPVFTWGAATGSAVTINIEKPSGPELDSYLETAPTTACSGGVFPPLVDYFFNGPEPPILSGTGTIQLGPFTPQIYLYAT